MINEGDVLVCSVEKSKEGGGVIFSCSVIKGGRVSVYTKNEESGKHEEYEEYEGIVVNEEKAKTSPCYRIDGTNLVFSKGIVGALSRDQIERYCPKIIEKTPAEDVICVHLDDFDELVKAVEERLRRRE